MSCKKGKPVDQAKAGHYRCKECGAVDKKKKAVCKPKKIKSGSKAD